MATRTGEGRAQLPEAGFLLFRSGLYFASLFCRVVHEQPEVRAESGAMKSSSGSPANHHCRVVVCLCRSITLLP